MSETNLTELKINYLSDEQYENAKTNNEINDNELYFTPDVDDEEGGSDIEIVDNLISTSTIAALSANQGRVLNEKITNLETLNDNVLVDYRIASAVNTVSFEDLNITEDYEYEIRIEGASSVATDVYTTYNDIDTNTYWQMGHYRSASDSSDTSNWSYTTGTRINKAGWYFAQCLRPRWGSIVAKLKIIKESETVKCVEYRWRTRIIKNANQVDSDCFGIRNHNNLTQINKLTFRCANGNFNVGTHFVIKKII